MSLSLDIHGRLLVLTEFDLGIQRLIFAPQIVVICINFLVNFDELLGEVGVLLCLTLVDFLEHLHNIRRLFLVWFWSGLRILEILVILLLGNPWPLLTWWIDLILWVGDIVVAV